jgi:hypothetical protein
LFRLPLYSWIGKEEIKNAPEFDPETYREDT